MKKLTLKEIHQESLKLLIDIHEFCVDNNIHYSLAYGTLIGAIRHKGFIPWDDDVDIVLTRPEYEKFCKLYESKRGYKLFYPENNSCFLNYARVCDCNSTMVRGLPWCHQTTGIWVDIFPLDAVDVAEDREKKCEELKSLSIKQKRARKKYGTFDKSMPLEDMFKLCLKKVFFSCYNLNSIRNKMMTFAQEIEYEKSNVIGNKTIPIYYVKDKYSKDLYSDYILVDFEGYKFYAMTGYDTVLRTIYGDYMQLPPEDKRGHHSHKIYWKQI